MPLDTTRELGKISDLERKVLWMLYYTTFQAMRYMLPERVSENRMAHSDRPQSKRARDLGVVGKSSYAVIA
jgi:hypothetical protein